MGVCSTSLKSLKPISEPTSNQPNDSISNMLHFSRTANLHIHVIDPIENRVIEDSQWPITLTEPILAFSQHVSLDSRTMWASACIIPGLDPRGCVKICQDMVTLDCQKGVLLSCEFDGHGSGGELIVSHCRDFVSSYFSTHIDSALSSPELFLTNLNEECDKSLNAETHCEAAGCTAVMMLIVKGEMYFSCVGDSRAMLATAAPPQELKVVQRDRGDDKRLLAEIKHRRSVTPEQTFCAVQLTQDQKPEDPGELARIRQAGGVVMRLEDENGRRVGPYRVWVQDGMYPGLAMSRSLGDAQAHEIGVVGSPIITTHTETLGMDFFLVIASDGIWDVMENQEVCDFIEAYRHKSLRNTPSPKQMDSVEPQRVTIAQLLCEEARARWLSVVEAEGVIIDDISCVILELQIHGERKRRAPGRTLAVRNDTMDVPGLDKTMRHKTSHICDPKRDAYTPVMGPEPSIRSQLEGPDDHVVGALINDPRRSSVSLIPVQSKSLQPPTHT